MPEAGFGLVEMVVAFTVLLVVLVATAGLTTTLLGQAADAHAQVTATDLADETLNQLANEAISQLSPNVNRDVTLSPVTLAGERYSLTQYLRWAGTGAAHSLCTTGSPPQVLQATVTISWGGGHHLAETSVINPPYGQAQSSDGWIAVLLQSAADPSQPPADVTAVGVVITPPGASGPLATERPDSTGCVYAAVPPGAGYSVTLQSPASPPFVSTDGGPSPTVKNVTVTQGQAADVSFLYDQAAQVSFAPAAAAPPLATGMPVSVSNPGLTSGSTTVVPAGGTGTAPADLFPFASGYQAWYGDCPAEAPGNPQSWTGTSPPTTAVAAGKTVTATTGGLVQLELAVTASGRGPIQATAQMADPTPKLCAAERYGLGTATAAGGTATLAVQIIPEDYTITVTDTADGATATLDVTWDPATSTWVDSATKAAYAPTSPIPVTVG